MNFPPMHAHIFHNIMWSKYKGGVFSALHALTEGTVNKFSFTQIAETESDRVALGGVDLRYHQYPYELVFEGNYYGPSLWQRTTALVNRAWATQADIVVLPGYERPEYWAMLLILVLRGKPRAVFCDSTAYDKPRKLRTSIPKRVFFSMCQGFFGYGQRSRDYLMSLGVPREKIFYRCQAAAMPIGYNEQHALQARNKALASSANPAFLYVGRLSPEKDLHTLLEAHKHLLRRLPNAELRLVGAGPSEAALKAESKKLGIEANVKFLGSMGIDGLALQYAEATTFVLPSTSEPWGLVVNEALSHGCPVVVSHRCGCVPELVIDGRTGYQFQAQDPHDLADKMMLAHELVMSDPTLALRCIEHIRQFSPMRAAEQIIGGCQRILAGVPGNA